VLRGLRNATVTEGGTIVAVPQHPSLWSRFDEIGLHQRRYRLGELEAKLGRNGFEVLFSTSFIALLLPLMVLSRLKTRAAGSSADVERETEPSAALNAILTAITRAEIRVTLAGLRWPIGGSRIVVARAV
jgi:hypothetical protein